MKKLNKFFAILVSLAMMATLCVCMAFAANPTTATDKITISKKLTLAQGLTAPGEFTFNTEFYSLDGILAASVPAEDKAGVPDLGSVTTNGLTGMSDENGNGYIIKNVDLATKSGQYPHAGVYAYKITEAAGSLDGVTYNTGNDAYIMSLYVDKDGNVTSIVIQEVDPTTGGPTGDKLKGDDTTPSTHEGEDDTATDVLFENLYKKIADDTTDPNNPQSTEKYSFVVTKAVTGDYSSTTKQFEFNLEIDASKAKTNYDDVTLVVKKAGAASAINPDANGKYTFTLAAGETLTVDGAPVGTTYTVTENLQKDDASKKYKGTVEVTENGAAATKATITNSTTEGENAKAQDALVGNGLNKAAFTNENTKDETPPEGILISNLPYIVLALVAIGGLVAYVVVRRRNADEA